MKCEKCGMNCGKCGKGKKLCAVSFGLAWGLSFGLLMVFIGWMAWLTGHGTEMVNNVASFYQGFAATFAGGLIGGIWGFIEGFILGLLIGFFYNLITCCCKMACCRRTDETCKCCSNMREESRKVI